LRTSPFFLFWSTFAARLFEPHRSPELNGYQFFNGGGIFFNSDDSNDALIEFAPRENERRSDTTLPFPRSPSRGWKSKRAHNRKFGVGGGRDSPGLSNLRRLPRSGDDLQLSRRGFGSWYDPHLNKIRVRVERLLRLRREQIGDDAGISDGFRCGHVVVFVFGMGAEKKLF
jgi:hypothetical protein